MSSNELEPVQWKSSQIGVSAREKYELAKSTKSRVEKSRASALPTRPRLIARRPDGVVSAKSTIHVFLNHLSHGRSVRALNNEYQEYFGAPVKTAN